MVVEEYELNLSLQEFLYFQECPMKFRLYRILNPIPYKESFESHHYSIENYRLRGYPPHFLKGIEYHIFFQHFHEHYQQSILHDVLSEELRDDPVKKTFWLHQRKRFEQLSDKSLWYPLKQEYKIMSTNLRGVIDCLEFCDDAEHLRLIDYKSNPHEKDIESLLFYCQLFNEYTFENDLDLPTIHEIGCYYYQTGNYDISKLENEDLQQLNEKLLYSKLEIRNQKFFRNPNACISCSYKIICKIEVSRK